MGLPSVGQQAKLPGFSSPGVFVSGMYLPKLGQAELDFSLQKYFNAGCETEEQSTLHPDSHPLPLEPPAKIQACKCQGLSPGSLNIQACVCGENACQMGSEGMRFRKTRSFQEASAASWLSKCSSFQKRT